MGQPPTLDRTNTRAGNEVVPRDVTPGTASILGLNSRPQVALW